jgi:predicted transcriptional regulator
MTISIKQHAIALSDKEFAILETIHKLGPCTTQQVQESVDDADLGRIAELLMKDLTDRGLLIHEENHQFYCVKPNYKTSRQRMIVMESF